MATVTGSLRNKVLVLDDVTTGSLTVTGSVSGNVTFGGEIYAKDSNSTTDPTVTFTGHTTTGMSIYYTGTEDELNLITGGVRRVHVNGAGITSFANVYTGSSSSFRNYGGVWKATTGLTGNGFEFSNSVDGTAMTLSSVGLMDLTGASAGVVARKGAFGPSQSGLHASYDLYNNGTTYLNGAVTVDDNLTVTGNLNITGDINSVSVTDLDVTDKTITLGVGQTEASSGGSGIVIDGSLAEIKWDESDDRWESNKTFYAATVNTDTITATANTDLQLNATTNFKLNLGGQTWISAERGGSTSPTNFTYFTGRLEADDFKLYEGTIDTKITHNGDTDTYIQFDTDRIRLFAGGTAKFDSNNTYQTTTGSGAGLTSLNASNITSGTLNVDRLQDRIFDSYRRSSISSSSHDFNTYLTTGTYHVDNWSDSGDLVQNGPTGSYPWGLLRVTNWQSNTGTSSGTGTYVLQEYFPHNTDHCFHRIMWNGSFTGWRESWGSGSDGSGSGLDADKVDGIQASSFLRSDTADTATGDIDFARASFGSASLHSTGGAHGVVTDSFSLHSGASDLMYIRPSALRADNGFFQWQTYNGGNGGDIELQPYGGSVTISTGSAGTSSANGLRFQTGSGNYSDGRWQHRFRKQDKGGGIPLYIDVSTTTANSFTELARFGTYTGNNYEFEVQGDINATGNLYDGGNQVFHEAYHPNADKWTTSRTLTLAGDLSGNVSFDGSANFTLTAAVADDSHNHIISNVDGLQTALDAKLTSSSGLNASNLTSGTIPNARLGSSVWYKQSDISVSSTNPFDNSLTATQVTDYGSYRISYTGASAHMISSAVGGSASIFHIGAHYNGDDFYMRVRTDGSSWKNWRKLWHDNNDGPSSGLNADLLDDQQGSYYLDYNNFTNTPTIPSTSSFVQKTGDTMTGTLTVDSGTSVGIKIDHDTFAKGLELHREDASNAASITFSNNSGESGIFYARHSDKRPFWRPGGTSDNHQIFTDNYHPNADKWTTARTISLTGAVTGSTSIDGSGNVSITTTATSDPTLTLSGDASGSATFTNLGNATLNVTINNDSHNHNHSDGDFTVNGGLVVEGSKDSGGTDMGFYQSAGTNIILKGDSNGRSGIFFESEKNGTNINDPSDYGFIQFHPYGYGNTTGESADMVIGTSNDSADHLILQAPYKDGVKVGYKDATSGGGLTQATVLHTDNYTTTLDSRYIRQGGTYSLGSAIRFQSNDAIDTTNGTQSPLEVFQDNAGEDAFMTFHISGDYAAYFGLDGASNDFVFGGWSKGAVKQRIFHDGYHPNADKWTTSRTLSLTGDVTGSVSWDGSGNASMTTTVANDSHTHDTRYVQKTGDTMTGQLIMSGTSPQIKFNDTDGDDFWIHANSNKLYILADRDDSGGWETPYPLELDASSNIGYIFAQRAFTEAYHPNADKWTTSRTLSLTGDVTGSTSWDGSGNASISCAVADNSHNHSNSSGDFTVNGNLYGKLVNNAYSSIYRMGGVYFTWDSDSYGTNTNHSIRSTYGDTYGDEITLNSYNHLRFNIDSNNNDATSYFEVGHHTTGTGNILMRLTSPSGNLEVDGNVTAYSSSISDAKYKDNIEPLKGSLDKVLQLQGVEFDWTATSRKGMRDIGFIAQEVEPIVPEVVQEHQNGVGEFSQKEETSKSIAYDKLVPLLVESIKELKAEIDDLKEQLKKK